jgi:hypothetical protein
VSGHPRLPLVFASTDAAAQARRLLGPTTVIENLTLAAIRARGMSHRRGGDKLVFLDDHGVVCRLVADRSPLSGRRCWRVVEVERSREAR